MVKMNNIGSKVNGRRNYFIRTEIIDGKFYVFGCGMGEAVDRGITKCYLREIEEYHIRMYEFTYKKDFTKTLQILKEIENIVNDINKTAEALD